MNSKRVCVMTDENLMTLPVMKTVVESLTKAGVQFDIFDKIRVEPTDKRQTR